MRSASSSSRSKLQIQTSEKDPKHPYFINKKDSEKIPKHPNFINEKDSETSKLYLLTYLLRQAKKIQAITFSLRHPVNTSYNRGYHHRQGSEMLASPSIVRDASC
jgi:hypothetical protein